jgi:hypothetical protein
MDHIDIASALERIIDGCSRGTVLLPTLRDRFAMAALQGLARDFHGEASGWQGALAAASYRIADEMLAARAPATDGCDR